MSKEHETEASKKMVAMITEQVRSTRNDALDAAIVICREFEKDGGSAAQCVAALTDFKDMLPPPPSKGH